VTVGGQLIVTGPWLIDTPIPGVAMGVANSGTSSLGISNDGNFYISASGSAPSRVLTAATDAVPSVFGRTGAVSAASGDYSVSQVTGAAPAASPTFSGTVTEPDGTTNTSSGYSFTHPLTLPNGSTATTQAAGDSSTKVATTAFATGTFAAMSVSNAVGDIPKISGNSPTPAITDSGVLAPPYTAPWLTVYRGGTLSATFAQNVVKMWGVVLTYPLSTSSVAYDVMTADTASNSYDIGIACAQTSCGVASAGTILLNTGATAASSFAPITGPRTLSWAQGTKVLQPGKYYVVITTNCASSCATLMGNGDGYAVTFQNAATAGTTSGGALANFTAPADVWSWGATIPALAIK
jgi:hypothetical protein